MQKILLCASLISLAGLALPAAGQEVDPEPNGGFVKLFNGKNLKGWKVYPNGTGKWTVKDGILVGSGPTSHLFSEKGDYKNFHLRVEAKINEQGNSGVYFRTPFGDTLFPRGWEAQIALSGDRVKTGSLFPDAGHGNLRDLRQKIVAKDLHKADEWFKLEVICKGNHIVIKVDGREALDWKDPDDRYQRGHFALQQHNPNTSVLFRKIEMRKLPDSK